MCPACCYFLLIYSSRAQRAAIMWFECASVFLPALALDSSSDVLMLLLCSSTALHRKSVSKDSLGKYVAGKHSYWTWEHSTMLEIHTFTLFGLGEETCFHLFTVKHSNYHDFLDVVTLFLLYVHVHTHVHVQIVASPLKRAWSSSLLGHLQQWSEDGLYRSLKELEWPNLDLIESGEVLESIPMPGWEDSD